MEKSRPYCLISKSAEDTHFWGKKIGALLKEGDVVCLYGDLGAGKTALAQGIGQALQVDAPMVSPTYTLIHEYQGFQQGRPLKLVHMDLYRLNHPEEAEVIGVEDAFQAQSVCLIEWPEVADHLLPEERLSVMVEGQADSSRCITLTARGSDWDERLITIVNGGPYAISDH